jgi:hypothetical protein
MVAGVWETDMANHCQETVTAVSVQCLDDGYGYQCLGDNHDCQCHVDRLGYQCL